MFERINEHKKDFQTGKISNSLVSHNILTNHTFDFQNSAIFAFIHEENKKKNNWTMFHSATKHNTTMTRFFQNFIIYRKNNIKRI